MLQTIERRNGYSLQTGYGHVRVLPFSNDAYVSIKDLLKVKESLAANKLAAERNITLEEIVHIVDRHRTKAT